MTAPDTPSSTLAGIRGDIETTADVYDLDGAGKNSYPVSAAMSRHARSLVAALEAVLALHHRRETPVRTHHICRLHAPWGLDTGYAEDCPDCTITEKWVCAHKQCRAECPDDDEWECPTYRAITSALTGTPQLEDGHA